MLCRVPTSPCSLSKNVSKQQIKPNYICFPGLCLYRGLSLAQLLGFGKGQSTVPAEPSSALWPGKNCCLEEEKCKPAMVEALMDFELCKGIWVSACWRLKKQSEWFFFLNFIFLVLKSSAGGWG